MPRWRRARTSYKIFEKSFEKTAGAANNMRVSSSHSVSQKVVQRAPIHKFIGRLMGLIFYSVSLFLEKPQ